MTGAQLRQRRKALGLSMQALATEAGIGIGTLQRWETQQPRTALERRGLDAYRVNEVRETIAALEQDHQAALRGRLRLELDLLRAARATARAARDQAAARCDQAAPEKHDPENRTT